jgi:hypothetical protein
MFMSHQLQLFPNAPVLPPTDAGSETLLEQTRQLFQHEGSNAELMIQVMSAIDILQEICEQPSE